MIQLRSKYEVARALGIPYRTVDKLARSRELASVPLPGNRVGFLERDVNEFVEARRRAAQPNTTKAS